MKLHFAHSFIPCTGRMWQQNNMTKAKALKDVTCGNCRRKIVGRGRYTTLAYKRKLRALWNLT